jgi:hypothetical protein
VTEFETPSVYVSPKVSVGVEGGLLPDVGLPKDVDGMTLLGG